MSIERRLRTNEPAVTMAWGFAYEALRDIDRRYGPEGEDPKEFHNAEHTEAVTRSAYALANLAVANGNLQAEDEELVAIAAVFHDFYHLPGDKSELLSANHAARRMKDSKIFKLSQIRKVRGMILATRVKITDTVVIQSANPKNYGELLMADADLSQLGKPFEEYWAATSKLYRERFPDAEPSQKEVLDFAYDFISKHQFLTPEAAELFPHQAENIRQLEAIYAEINGDS